MNEKKISTTVYITLEQRNKLKVISDKTKVPIAEYIREGVDMIINKNADRLPGQTELLGGDNKI